MNFRNLNIIIASSGQGKTSLLCKAAEDNVNIGNKTLYLTSETRAVDIARRISPNITNFTTIAVVEIQPPYTFEWIEVIISDFRPTTLILDHLNLIESNGALAYNDMQFKIDALSELSKKYKVAITWTAINKTRQGTL